MQALVLELLRAARIRQGMATESLGVARSEILDLMAQLRIPSGLATTEEAEREIAETRRFFAAWGPDSDDQRQ